MEPWKLSSASVLRQELAEKLYFIQNSTGGVLNPFDSWLLIRGIKTLSVGIENKRDLAKDIEKALNGSKIY